MPGRSRKIAGAGLWRAACSDHLGPRPTSDMVRLITFHSCGPVRPARSCAAGTAHAGDSRGSSLSFLRCCPNSRHRASDWRQGSPRAFASGPCGTMCRSSECGKHAACSGPTRLGNRTWACRQHHRPARGMEDHGKGEKGCRNDHQQQIERPFSRRCVSPSDRVGSGLGPGAKTAFGAPSRVRSSQM